MGEEDWTRIQQYILLETMDEKWKDHLYAMEVLKHGIGLRGYAQMNPKDEFKKEGYEKFEMLKHAIADQVTDLVFKVELQALLGLARNLGDECFVARRLVTMGCAFAPPSPKEQDGREERPVCLHPPPALERSARSRDGPASGTRRPSAGTPGRPSRRRRASPPSHRPSP